MWGEKLLNHVPSPSCVVWVDEQRELFIIWDSNKSGGKAKSRGLVQPFVIANIDGLAIAYLPTSTLLNH